MYSFDIVESLQSRKVKIYTPQMLQQSITVVVTLDPKAQTQQTTPAASEEDKMIFKIEYDQYVKKQEQYQNNMIKAYTTIFDYCSKTIQAHIREWSDYKSKIQNNLIELMKVIKKLMHSPIRAKYAYETLTNAFERLLNIKQQENKELLDYTPCYEQEWDILKEYSGKDILYMFVEHTDEYKTEKDKVVQ